MILILSVKEANNRPCVRSIYSTDALFFRDYRIVAAPE